MDMHYSRFSQTGDGGQFQPLDDTRDGSCENSMGSFGASSEVEDRKLSINRCLSGKLSCNGNGGATLETVHSGPCPAAGSQVRTVKLLLPRGEITMKASATEEPLNPAPVDLTSSATVGSDSPISFTIPPTEEDLEQFQPSQDRNGYIKRPPNAFIVWSCVHRRHNIFPGVSTADTSIILGREWSKLSEEQQKPYYEVAQRLKRMHGQRFPDYEFRPPKKKKKYEEHLPSGQGAGQDLGISSSRAMHPAQIMLQGPRRNPYSHHNALYLGSYFNSHYCQCYPMGHCPNVCLHHSRYASSSTEQVKNDHHTYPQ